MKHYMKLKNDPFLKINVGDIIEFTNVSTLEKLCVKVLNLYHYKDFNDLYKNHDKISIGYSKNDTIDPSDMLMYYSKEEIEKYGTLAILIEVISLDIDIKNEAGAFKLRTSGIIIKDEKVLVLKSKTFKGYVYPGGHIMIGELSNYSIKRELKEELSYNFLVGDLFCVHENTYQVSDKIKNEVCYYYRITSYDDIPDKSFIIKEVDNGQIKKHEYHWIHINDLIKENVRPLDISRLIQKDKDAKNLILSTNEGVL